MSEKSVDVLVVDDHQLIIDGIRSILHDEPDIKFAGGVNSVDDAMSFLEVSQVDVVLADVNMPGKTGVELTRLIKEKYPEIQVLALTMHEDYSVITQMIEAGASGYILKRTNMNEVLEAIKIVSEKGKYLGRDVQSIMIESISTAKPIIETKDNEIVPLTAREKEILNLVAKELTNEQIAEKLFISERTVETHRRNIFTKTKTKSIVGLIKYAIKKGLISHENSAE